MKVDLVADMAVYNPFDFFLEPDAEKYPFAYEARCGANSNRSSMRRRPEPALRAWLDAFPRPKAQPTADFLVELNQRLSREIEYVVRMEPGIQTPQETLTLKRGSCRDSSWLLVQILRHLGLASRFVSGYLIQLTADVKSSRRTVRYRRTTSPICTRGPRCICRAQAGSVSIRPRDC